MKNNDFFYNGVVFGVGLMITFAFWGDALALSIGSALRIVSVWDLLDDEKVETLVDRAFDLIDGLKFHIDWIEEGN